MAEVVVLRDVLHLRTRIGDGNEAISGFLLTNGFLHACEEILFIDVGFERAAGFAGDDEERVLQIDLCFDRLDLRGIGGIENVQLGKSVDFTEGEPQDFRAKARASHAE